MSGYVYTPTEFMAENSYYDEAAAEWYSNHSLRDGLVNTAWLYKRFCRPTSQKSGSMDFRIPIASAALYQPTALPVEPYLMGYWLGNGNAIKPEITIITGDTDFVLAEVRKHHTVGSVWDNVGDSVIARIPDLKPVLLKAFHDKAIPTEYL